MEKIAAEVCLRLQVTLPKNQADWCSLVQEWAEPDLVAALRVAGLGHKYTVGRTTIGTLRSYVLGLSPFAAPEGPGWLVSWRNNQIAGTSRRRQQPTPAIKRDREPVEEEEVAFPEQPRPPVPVPGPKQPLLPGPSEIRAIARRELRRQENPLRKFREEALAQGTFHVERVAVEAPAQVLVPKRSEKAQKAWDLLSSGASEDSRRVYENAAQHVAGLAASLENPIAPEELWSEDCEFFLTVVCEAFARGWDPQRLYKARQFYAASPLCLNRAGPWDPRVEDKLNAYKQHYKKASLEKPYSPFRKNFLQDFLNIPNETVRGWGVRDPEHLKGLLYFAYAFALRADSLESVEWCSMSLVGCRFGKITIIGGVKGASRVENTTLTGWDPVCKQAVVDMQRILGERGDSVLPFSSNFINRVLKQAQDELGWKADEGCYEHLVVHSFRHGRAVDMFLLEHASVAQVAVRLGDTEKVVRDTYLRWCPTIL